MTLRRRENQGQQPNFRLGSIDPISSAVLEIRLLSLIFPLNTHEERR
jgi:hypothetical protein